MELEITIRVPLGASGVSVEQRATGPVEATPGDAGPPPPPGLHLDAVPGADGDETASGSDVDAGGGQAHEPPSPADFGLSPAGAVDDLGPPSIETIERVLAEATSVAGQPPGLDGLDLPDPLGHDADAVAGPPGLPDPSQVPDVSPEFAPPPIEDLEASPEREASRDAGGPGKRPG